MTARRALVAAAVLSLGAVAWSAARSRGADATAPSPQRPGLRLDTVATGLESPVHLAAPAGDARLFLVEQAGRIRVLRGGVLQSRPFLDITGRVGSGGERGLLSVAFHPQYRSNGRFFVNYTDRRGDTRVAEFRAGDPAADVADPASERLLLQVRQPYANHNGGHVLFGPDGRLYVGMGDGGAAGDPHGNAQDPDSRLGKVLRIDVDGGAVETFALGLRNPWRMAFDAGLLYIADVGQGSWEEVNVAPAGRAGLNYGWRSMEGTHCYLLPVCAREGKTLPALEYSHDDGCSVTGGVVYRGRAVPVLAGHYLYSDWCGGWLRSFRYQDGRATDLTTWRLPDLGDVVSFGTDGAGEVYVVTGRGLVVRLAAAR